MQSGNGSSIWRSLAVAFGDGLAFGVGVKLSQNAARQVAARQSVEPAARMESGDVADRLAQVEQTMKRLERAPAAIGCSGGEQPKSLDAKVLEAIVNALEARLNEHTGQVERRLADMDAKTALEIKALDEQDNAIARKVTEDLNAMEGQMISLNREFGEAVARIVAEQVASQVEARASALQTAMKTAVESAVRAQLGPLEHELRESLAGKDREIAELREQLSAADAGMLEMVSAIGQICRRAAERTQKTEPSSGPAPVTVPERTADIATIEPGVPEAEESRAAVEPPLPGFAQAQKPSRLWRVPLVSSMVLILTGGVLLAHYL